MTVCSIIIHSEDLLYLSCPIYILAASLDNLFMSCSILYKGKTITYADMFKDIERYSSKLKITQLYKEKIYPFELNKLFIIDTDYYAAGKLLKSAEDQLSFGRKALLDSYRILDLNMNSEWKHGYGPIYYQRCFNANNAIIWYNNVFDSILQIIYIAFGIYKHHPNYNKSHTFHKILKDCDYRFLNKFYKEHQNIKNFKELWNLISKVSKSNKKINTWANFIKHKGGINYRGSTPEPPINAKIIMLEGSEIKSEEFEPPNVTLDEVISELEKHHLVLCDAFEALVDFIGFNKVNFIPDGEMQAFPEEKSYKKIIFRINDK